MITIHILHFARFARG